MVNFCSIRCAETSIYPNPSLVKAPHEPSHDVMKFATFVHTYRDLSRVYKQASCTVKLLRQAFPVVQTVAGRNQGSQECSSFLQSDSPTGNALKDISPARIVPVGCGICRKILGLPCWICTHCSRNGGGQSPYICDECEENRLLMCTTCSAPFEQPEWYYGTKPRDTFQCVKCIIKRIPAIKFFDNDPHTYLHHLVRCRAKEESIKEPTTEERLLIVEKKVDVLDARMTKLEAYLERIERKLEPSGASELSLASG
ncbi:hypothetical protein BDY19DRAFT_1051579 [Irpex rosettiformis]|uniref:Uncharacterized protein n=2 Tax=Irpex rosettiformis TaxID=378272 RepID=A0ACB8TLW0_9APHY|nr:hypothetical protein BDY19DRAFT_1051997 [Irpex rosettiformis]KAI0083948.1 hypothetical protein BDY19DRAFT_1051579 [Irpex rosettiformis]